MRCVVLGAGYATRLYPLTRERPKPLLPVADVPILERILEQVLPLPGLERVHVVSNHRFHAHYASWLRSWRERSGATVPVEAIDDGTASNDDRLGAIGDIHFAIREAKIDDDLLIVGGDNLFEFDLGDFLAFARSKGSAVALKDLRGHRELLPKYGLVELDKAGRVIDFEEKPPRPRSTLISIAVYHFARAHVPMFDTYIREGHNPDAPGYYLQWFFERTPLYGYIIKGEWFDIGDIDSYDRANELYLSR